MNSITRLDVRCENCNGYIGPFSIESFGRAIKGMKLKNGNWHRAVFCSYECKKTYEDSFIVEGTGNSAIYELDGLYFPYYGSCHGFYDIEECRNFITFRKKMLSKERLKFHDRKSD